MTHDGSPPDWSDRAKYPPPESAESERKPSTSELTILITRHPAKDDGHDQIDVELVRDTGSCIQKNTFVGVIGVTPGNDIVVNRCRIRFSGGALWVTDLEWEKWNVG